MVLSPCFAGDGSTRSVATKYYRFLSSHSKMRRPRLWAAHFGGKRESRVEARTSRGAALRGEDEGLRVPARKLDSSVNCQPGRAAKGATPVSRNRGQGNFALSCRVGRTQQSRFNRVEFDTVHNI